MFLWVSHATLCCFVSIVKCWCFKKVLQKVNYVGGYYYITTFVIDSREKNHQENRSIFCYLNLLRCTVCILQSMFLVKCVILGNIYRSFKLMYIFTTDALERPVVNVLINVPFKSTVGWMKMIAGWNMLLTAACFCFKDCSDASKQILNN